MNAPKLLTEQQAAEVAGVSRKTIRRLIEQGRLPAADYGTAGQRNYRIHPDALANVKPATASAEPLSASRRRRRVRDVQKTAAAYLPRVWP